MHGNALEDRFQMYSHIQKHLGGIAWFQDLPRLTKLNGKEGLASFRLPKLRKQSQLEMLAMVPVQSILEIREKSNINLKEMSP